MDGMRSWIMSIAGAAVISAVCLAITPEGRTKRVVRLCCGLVTLLCLLSPLAGRKIDISDKLAQVKWETEEIMSQARDSEQTLTRAVIQEKYGAYISDKGIKLGLDITEVSVKVKWNSGGYWYPTGAEITGTGDAPAKEELERCIASELGVDRNEIYWS